MNETEYNYHLEVQSRVQRKLMEAGLTILEENSSEGWFSYLCK